MIGWLYDLLAARAEDRGLRDMRHQLVGGLEGEVLEVGAGTGLNLPEYERATRVVALEPDSSMAKRLPRRAAEAKVPVEVIAGSADARSRSLCVR